MAVLFMTVRLAVDKNVALANLIARAPRAPSGARAYWHWIVWHILRLSTEPLMFAVIRTGGKQLRVAPNDRIVIERLHGEPGTAVSFGSVLMLGGDSELLVGRAVPASARVFAEIIAQEKGDKVLIFKKKRRKNHRRLRGHRQPQTVVRVTAISASGEAVGAETPAAAPDPAPAPDTATADAAQPTNEED